MTSHVDAIDLDIDAVEHLADNNGWPWMIPSQTVRHLVAAELRRLSQRVNGRTGDPDDPVARGYTLGQDAARALLDSRAQQLDPRAAEP